MMSTLCRTFLGRARLIAILALAVAWTASIASGQLLMMPDSTNARMVLFSPFDGSVVNSNLFPLTAGTTPVHALLVNNEIWVTEQLGDKVSRWSLTGTSLGAISGGLDNIRGAALIGSTYYVTNAGTANGAPGASLIRFDLSGNNLGSSSTAVGATSPFSILPYQGDILVGSSNANDDIHRYTLAGASVGTFHNTTSLSFVQQMNYAANGDILAATFSTNVVATLDPTNGSVISTFAAPGARGVWQLGNGNILWTNGSGAHVYDVVGQASTQVYAGGGRYISVIPEPTSALFLVGGVACLAILRRRVRG